jgi:hypothetical protein
MNKLQYFAFWLVIVLFSISFTGCLKPIAPGDASSEIVSVEAITTNIPETTDPTTETTEDTATGPVTTEETELPATTEEIEEQPITAGDWILREGYGMFDEGYYRICELYTNVYSDESVANCYILYEIHGQTDLENAEKNVVGLLKTNSEYRNLPELYLLIKELKTSKRDFVQLNDYFIRYNRENGTEASTYTDDQIEYLFGDYGIDETIEHLKAPWAYYYRGRLYTIFNIFQIENEKLIAEMYSKGNLEEYIQNMKKLLNGDVANYLEGAYEVGDEERVILNMISDFETLPLKEFQSKHRLEYGIGFDWENYVPEELRP